MKTIYLLIFFLLAGVLGMTGCGGTGDDAGSTTTREVTGNLASPNEAALIKGAHLDENSGCAADSVIATATNGEATSSEVEEDCSFSLSLIIGQSYVISFAMDDQFLATLIFDSGISGFTTSNLPLANGSNALDLGTITISGTVAISENEPLEQCDRDDDGTHDLDDSDDDEDGTEDEDEEDCDFDGSLDDYDEEDLDCDEEESEDDHAHVLSVKPYDGDEWVDLEREVKARMECEVDQSTVTAETFYVVSEDGMDIIECEYEFSGSGSSGNRIECDHDDQDFLSDTYYIATIDGVMCMDGRSVESISWSWLTEETDEDEGCYEDELDDEDELEDEEEDDEDDEDDDEDEDENDDNEGEDDED